MLEGWPGSWDFLIVEEVQVQVELQLLLDSRRCYPSKQDQNLFQACALHEYPIVDVLTDTQE